MKSTFFWSAALCGAALGLCGAAQAADTSAQQQLQRWEQQAGSAGVATRGQQFFASTHGGEWSCASCHNNPPTTAGKHASTGKRIDVLAPGVNAQAFAETRKVDKWFKRNCNDVLKRECSAQEKADVMAWLLSLK